MDIKTKYNIGDSFWVLKENRAENRFVDGILVNISRYYGCYQNRISTHVSYESHSGGGYVKVKECDFHPSKEALLASL